MLLQYAIISGVAVVVSGLTLFSGFGLGTVLMPTFALFFPVPVAVATTAVVHLANNVFKVVLVGRKADWSVVIKFAIPAAAAAMLGAALLHTFALIPAVVSYQLGGRAHEVTPLKLIIGLVIIFFALFELVPRFQELSFSARYLTMGGLLSGFFGGLSGIQGALRSAFLIKAGLDKEAFIGTGIVSAVIVDLARLLVYGISFYAAKFYAIPPDTGGMALAATLSAFLGAFVGSRLIREVTLQSIQIIVGVMLILVGFGLATGLF